MAKADPGEGGAPASAHDRAAGERIGAFTPFRYPAFRAIWSANLASNLGTAIQSVAAAWLMTGLSGSHVLIALVQSSVTLPILVFGVFAGAIADNFDRRRVMLAAQCGLLVTSAVLALTTRAGGMTPGLLLFFTLTMGAASALNAPAWHASVRQQVGMAALPQALALNTIAFNLARGVGPALGGLLLSLWDVSLAFAVNSASFIVMIVVLWRWRPEPRAIERKPILPAIAAGLRHCAGSREIRRIITYGVALGFGLSCFQSLVPSIARDQLRGDELDFGLMLTLFGAGSITGALAVTRLRRAWGANTAIALATLLMAASLLLVSQARSVGFALPVAFAAGAAWVVVLTSLGVAMQLHSPESILGRCLSIYQAATYGAMALGAWTWGMVADSFGLATAITAAGVFMPVALALLRRAGPMPAAEQDQRRGARAR